jgi:hypothetical protein
MPLSQFGHGDIEKISTTLANKWILITQAKILVHFPYILRKNRHGTIIFAYFSPLITFEPTYTLRLQSSGMTQWTLLRQVPLKHWHIPQDNNLDTSFTTSYLIKLGMNVIILVATTFLHFAAIYSSSHITMLKSKIKDTSVKINLLWLYFYTVTSFDHVRWGPCPHSMARPRVADRG